METAVKGSRAGVFSLTKQFGKGSNSTRPDVLIEVEGFLFYLHKFPLAYKSPYLHELIEEHSSKEDALCAFTLNEIPGGAQSFEIVAKFCYGENIELTPSNVVPILCAAYFLNMTDEYMKGNLVAQTERFLFDKTLSSWKGSIQALLSCKDVMVKAEELGIVSSCIDSLAYIVTYDMMVRNGIKFMGRPPSDLTGSSFDWWYSDVCSLRLCLFKRLVRVLISMGHGPVNISDAVLYYARNYGSDPSISGIWSVDERNLLEEIVVLLPVQKGATSTESLFSMLCSGIRLNANATCIENLERRIGAQLDEASLDDFLAPDYGGTRESAACDIDCIRRIIKQFVQENLRAIELAYSLGEHNWIEECCSLLGKIERVAKKVDSYLTSVALDGNLEMEKFRSLASAIPEVARPSHDALFRAVCAYIEHHPRTSERQKERLCQLVNTKKLSPDACGDALLNGKLPLLFMFNFCHF